MKKILITGAAGMLGHALTDVFRDGYELVLTDRTELDITDPEAISDALQRHRPDALINAAAYTDVDGAETEHGKVMAHLLNATAVGYLAQAAAIARIPIVHYSTDYVFDGQRAEGYDESHQPLVPLNAYGESKAEGERQLAAHTSDFYLLRTQWLYGKHGKNFVDTMLSLAKKGESIRVVSDQYGSPTWTHDLATQTKLLLEQRFPYGSYHVTNSGTTTWFDFAREVFRCAAVDAQVEPVSSEVFPRPAKRPKYSALTNTKLPPLRPWQEALAAYLATHHE